MALIELKQLGKTFKGKTQTVEALKGISLEIEKGDIYGIIGMSGAGKSTLVRCINFLEKPTEGSVIIDGKDLSSLTDKELRKLRRQVSMIFQHFNLLQQRNVRGNISFAMEIAGLDAETRRTYIREMLEHDESVYARVLTKPAAFKEYFIRYGGADFRKVKQYPGYAWQTLVYAKDRIAFVLRKFLAPAVTYVFTQLAVAASGAGKLTGDERAARLIEIAVPEKPEKQISAAKREKLSFKQRAINICGIIAEAAKRAWSAVSGWFKAAKAAISADGAKAFFKNLGSAIVRGAKKAWAKTVCGAKAFIAWLKPATARVSAAIALSASGIIKAHRNERIDELLDIVSLKERQFNYPSQLSGGQQQRVAIARALANNPQIILCDEATSALDPTTTTQILNLLREINRNLGITIVIITHEMKVVESICSHVAIIDNGVLAENGTVERIFKHPETEVARKLIFRKDGASAPVIGERVVRVVFDGQESTEPVIANLILECGIAVNIMHADTRDVGGKAFGQMLLQLPEDKLQQEKAIYYLRTRGLTVEDIKEAAE